MIQTFLSRPLRSSHKLVSPWFKTFVSGMRISKSPVEALKGYAERLKSSKGYKH
jgi:hypothetical protein